MPTRLARTPRAIKTAPLGSLFSDPTEDSSSAANDAGFGAPHFYLLSLLDLRTAEMGYMTNAKPMALNRTDASLTSREALALPQIVEQGITTHRDSRLCRGNQSSADETPHHQRAPGKERNSSAPHP